MEKKEKGKETYVVKFDTDGGSSISNQIVNKGKMVNKPKEPTKEGYKFVNWYTDDIVYNFSLKVYKDLVLTAKWEKVEEKPEETKKPTTNTPKPSTAPTKKEYTITFDSNGGSSVGSQKISEGNKVTRLNNPTREGYKFIHWTLDGVEYDFSSPVKSDITLVAKWEKIVKNVYTIKFNSNGGSNISDQVVEEGSKVSNPNNPTRNGYKFVGWTLDGNEYDFSSTVNRDITLVANWTQKNYTVKVSIVDDYSPARVLTTYEEGTKIIVKNINYTDGTFICTGINANVNKTALVGETKLQLELDDGTKVIATIVE